MRVGLFDAREIRAERAFVIALRENILAYLEIWGVVWGDMEY